MKCNIQIKDNGEISVRGANAPLFREAMLRTNQNEEKSIKIWSVAETKEFKDFGETPTYDNVIKYLEYRDRIDSTPFTSKELSDSMNASIGNTFFQEDFIKTFTNEKGLFEINSERMKKVGLYSNSEIYNILRDENIQKNIKQFYNKSLNFTAPITTSESSVVVKSEEEFTSLGFFKRENPDAVKEELGRVFSGVKDKDDFDKRALKTNIEGLKYEDVKRDFESKTAVAQYVENPLTNELELKSFNNTYYQTLFGVEIGENNEKAVEIIDLLTSLSPEQLADTSDIKYAFNTLSKELVNSGIDFVGIENQYGEIPSPKIMELLFHTKNILTNEDISEEGVQNFADVYNEVFEKSPLTKKSIVDGVHTNTMKIQKSTISDTSLFQNNSLIRIKDNLYKKINRNYEDFYDSIYELMKNGGKQIIPFDVTKSNRALYKERIIRELKEFSKREAQTIKNDVELPIEELNEMALLTAYFKENDSVNDVIIEYNKFNSLKNINDVEKWKSSFIQRMNKEMISQKLKGNELPLSITQNGIEMNVEGDFSRSFVRNAISNSLYSDLIKYGMLTNQNFSAENENVSVDENNVDFQRNRFTNSPTLLSEYEGVVEYANGSDLRAYGDTFIKVGGLVYERVNGDVYGLVSNQNEQVWNRNSPKISTKPKAPTNVGKKTVRQSTNLSVDVEEISPTTNEIESVLVKLSTNKFENLVGTLKKSLGGRVITTEVEFKTKLKELGLNDSEIQQMVMAYHGSPHLFDKFSTDYMGSGEGAQAFGWGLYFTELESIARNYADKLTVAGIDFTFVNDTEDGNFYNIFTKALGYVFENERMFYYEAKRYYDENLTKLEDTVVSQSSGKTFLTPKGKFKKFFPKIDELKGSDFIDYSINNNNKNVKIKSNKNLYKVALHKGKQPSEYTWLEWDKPLKSDKTFSIVSGEQNLTDETKVTLSRVRKETSEVEQKQSLRQAIESYKMLLNTKDGDTFGYGSIMTPEIKNKYSTVVEELQNILKYKGNFISLKNKTGNTIYDTLSKALGSPKAASLFLLENGIDGIKYPAETISRGATSDNARGFNYVVFDESAVTIEEVVQFMRTKDGNIFGATFPDGTIYVDQNNLNANTPIHEYGHLWINIVKQQNEALYNEVIDVVKRDEQAMEEVRNDGAYSHLTTENQIAEEVLARQIGNVGEESYWKDRDRGFIERILDFIKSLFSKNIPKVNEWTLDKFQNTSLQELSKNISEDLLKGEPIFEKESETFKSLPSETSNDKALSEGVNEVQKIAEEYKIANDIVGVQHSKVSKLFPNVSKMISDAYENTEDYSDSKEVKESYKALEEDTIKQYEFIVSKGLSVSRWEKGGEPYPNSKSMLKDIRENKHLYFLPNSEAFGKDEDSTEGRLGLKPTDIYLDDGYKMTLSEVFRVVHDYFGHGILGNQFGAIGEENATLQHLDLYSDKALPAVVYQTRGQNSWVNFSGVNDESLRKMKEGRETSNEELLKQGQDEFKFATPKDNILPKIFNFKTYETARRINEQEEIRKSETYLDPRGKHEDSFISDSLSRYTENSSGKLNGFSRRILGVSKRLGGYDVDVIAEYEGSQEVEGLIKKVFPKFKGTQKIYEISNGDVYRELMIEALETNKFKSSVTVHSAEDFSNMRLFVTEDGSTGITLTKQGFLGGAFGNPKANRPNNLAQMMLLGIKEGAITAEAFDTVLPDYYSMFGLKAVSRTAFNEEYRPLKENGALEDWDYDTYYKFNKGKPDVVFFIYDGGSRETIQERIGQFDSYNSYQKDFTESYDKESYDEAYRFMEVEAINKSLYEAPTISETTEKESETFKALSSIPLLSETEALKAYKNIYSSKMFDWKNQEC